MNLLCEKIKREIAENGIITFARFMELSLYCPVYGYYEKEADILGRAGDFYTSVSVGELFGELLAFQFAGWLEEIQAASPGSPMFDLVEAGAHDGRLAGDILRWLREKRPRLCEQVNYVIVEPSPRRRRWQQEKLQPFAPQVRWLDTLPDLASDTSPSAPRAARFSGVMFSNELLDAFPVHRLGWDARNKKWFEWGVTVENGEFVWARGPRPISASTGEGARSVSEDSPRENPILPSSTRQLPFSLLEVLPDHYTIEVCPAAERWWRTAASLLERGRLMTIDYGFAAGEMFSPGRTEGTLRAYFRHHVSGDLLAHAGEQDLTAHVNFSALQAAGEAAGLTTEFFCTQAQFLTWILERALKDESFGGCDSARARQFQTLTHPEHLGRSFRVLVQRK